LSEGEGADQERHRCLVRFIIELRIRDRNLAHNFLNGYTDEQKKYHRGWNEMHKESRLDKDVREQWAAGNRGEVNEWK